MSLDNSCENCAVKRDNVSEEETLCGRGVGMYQRIVTLCDELCVRIRAFFILSLCVRDTNLRHASLNDKIVAGKPISIRR